jgi:hypothetical protein
MLLYSVVSNSQCLDGITGCVNIPTAVIPTEGSVLFGLSYWSLLEQPNYYKENATAYFADLAYFPWCEVMYRRTMSQDKRLGTYTDHDRMASIKIQCLKQNKYIPALAFGINDLFTAAGSSNQYYYSCYGVLTKEIKLNGLILLPSLGYGFSINERDSYLNAWFGGVDVSSDCIKHLHFMMDYDTHQISFGMRYKLFDRIYMISAYNLKEKFSFGVIYQIHLI